MQSGSRKSYNDLYDRYSSLIYNVALNFVPDRAEAEDVVQEVFIGIYRSLGSFRQGSSLKTWIYKIAVNASLENIRRKKRKKRLGVTVPVQTEVGEAISPITSTLDHPGVLLEQKELAEHLFAAINNLDDAQRSAYTLKHLEGLSQKEVSTVLETSVSAVESLLVRAKRNLRRSLKSYYLEIHPQEY